MATDRGKHHQLAAVFLLLTMVKSITTEHSTRMGKYIRLLPTSYCLYKRDIYRQIKELPAENFNTKLQRSPCIHFVRGVFHPRPFLRGRKLICAANLYLPTQRSSC